jgi:23S rRNA (uracil1939-C5)-methyltransferase
MKLRIEKAIYGGAGLSHVAEGDFAGKAVFTPLTLLGELVEAHITDDKQSFINAEVDSVIEPSPQRTVPPCPYFGVCGGCSYQHANYEHQAEMKVEILRESFERVRIPDLPVIQTVVGEAWHYRNRIRLHVQSHPFALGYRERRSHRSLVVDQCPIAAPELEKAMATITEIGESLRLGEFCNEVELFSADEGSLLITFFLEKTDRETHAIFNAISEALKRALPQLIGTGAVVAQGKKPARLMHIWGASSLRYRAAEFEYQVSLGSFFQVNRFLVDKLVDLVARERRGRLAWDLYAGVGLFARALTAGFERVIAVESSPASASDLRHNLQAASHRVLEMSTLEFLQKQKASPPDLVVIDPPRAGLGAAITAELSRIGPVEIIYVSCDPSTLSRDVAALLKSGYDLRTITMVDMFPQTFHLESVSVLTRR